MVHTVKLSTCQLVFLFPEPDAIPLSGALWVIVSKNEVAVTAGDQPTIYCTENPAGITGSLERVQYLGHSNATPCYPAEIADGTATLKGWEYSGVRELFGRVPVDELAIAALAVQIRTYAVQSF